VVGRFDERILSLDHGCIRRDALFDGGPRTATVMPPRRWSLKGVPGEWRLFAVQT
jgi:hypothetical protein